MIHISPTPPTPPGASDDIAILRAWMDAEIGSPAPSCAAPVVDELGYRWRCLECPACKVHAETIVAAVETAIERCRDRRAGRLGTHYESIPVAVRPLVGRRDGEGLKSILGRWERDDRDRHTASRARFVTGLAQLTEAQAEVYWWELRGWQVWEMQRERTAPRARFSRELWVSVESVERDLGEAKAKVARVFGL